MKKILVTLAAALLLAWRVAPAQASPTKRFDARSQTCRILTFHNSGWVSRGARLFRDRCKSCHYRGNDKGAKFLHSGSKSMKGWNRIFAKRYVRCARTGVWDGMEQEDLAQINDYLYRNASNSYDPNDAEDCG